MKKKIIYRQHQQGSNIEQVNYALTTSLSSEKSKEKLTTETETKLTNNIFHPKKKRNFHVIIAFITITTTSRRR